MIVLLEDGMHFIRRHHRHFGVLADRVELPLLLNPVNPERKLLYATLFCNRIASFSYNRFGITKSVTSLLAN